MFRLKANLIVLILLILCFQSNSQNYKVEFLSSDQGLSRNLVQDIFKDSKGFLWIATAKGLDRYDGYDFVHFGSSQRDNYIPADFINCVREDFKGIFWIATENGLFYYSPITGEILPANTKLKIQEPNLNQNIKFLDLDENGNIWVGHSGGLSLISELDGEYVFRNIVRDATISAILHFNGNVYVGSANKVFRIIKGANNQFSRLNPESKLSNLVAEVTTLHYDSRFIWIGTSNGLYKYEPVSERLDLLTNTIADTKSISSNVITDIKHTKDNQLLVGTLIGLNIYDYQKNSFKRINSANPSPESLNNDFVSCILVDEHFIWVGTEKGGVNKLAADQRFFRNLEHNPRDAFSISRNPVNAIYETSKGDLLIGTVEGGLNIGKVGSSTFKHFLHNPQNPLSISHNSVSSFCEDVLGNIWIGTWGNGLNYVSVNQLNNPVFGKISTRGDQRIASSFIASTVSDPVLKGVWVGSRDGLDFVSSIDKKVTSVLGNLSYEQALRFITGMLIDSQRRLWIGTSNGLFYIDLNKSIVDKNQIRFKHFHYRLADPKSKIIEKINCIFQAKDGSIWFGSNGNGLYRLNEKDFTFSQWDDNSGIIDNVIYGILEDESGSLWMSTDKGLCAFNPTQNSFRNFTTNDGLISNQFYWDAFYKSKDGKMFFGNVLGLTYFDPLKYTIQSNISKVAVTKISVLNQIIYPSIHNNTQSYLHFSGTHMDRLSMNESEKAFSIEFSALNSITPKKVIYSYRLVGFDDDWKEVRSDRRFANFTNLRAGDYVFEVKCTNPDGTWSSEISSLNIYIKPPFYKQAWFILLILALIGYLIYSFVSYRFKLLKDQEIHLKELVKERTLEIEIQKEEIKQQAEQIENATIDKIAFFTNITHEFRTPVTLILGPVERALKLSVNPKVIEQLEIVQRNSKFLLSLINQLMDFRKIDSDKMELNRNFDDFIVFLEDILIPFEDLAKDRDVHFKKLIKVIPSVLLFDKDGMRKVMTNLLSNALKFTPDGGKVSVTASTYIDKKDGKEKLYIAVKNSGSYIPENDLDKIFERFYQSKNSSSAPSVGQSGTGIGLFLCKKIIELNGGSIEAKNTNNGEVSFRFIIPIERRAQLVAEFEGKKVDMNDKEQVDEIKDEIKVLSKTKPTLLIVDDNKDLRTFVRSFMNEDFNILEAANGLIGLELTNRYQPNIILSDIMMPEMDGIEFCKQVKSNFTTSHIPVVFLTAKSATDTQIESYKTGADAFLVKPFDENLLKTLIKSLAEKKHKVQSSFADNMDTTVLEFEEESQDKRFLDKALQLIKDNYANPDFDVAEFIEMMAISRSLLHKKLTNLAGQSASRFIRTYRLNMARELILKNRKSHSLNISEIAYQVGFNDPKYFTRCFTKHFGIQPSNFMEEE